MYASPFSSRVAALVYVATQLIHKNVSLRTPPRGMDQSNPNFQWVIRTYVRLHISENSLIDQLIVDLEFLASPIGMAGWQWQPMALSAHTRLGRHYVPWDT